MAARGYPILPGLFAERGDFDFHSLILICSGRNPIPNIRPGIRRSLGYLSTSFSKAGGATVSRDSNIGSSTFLCRNTCTRCVTFAALSRRVCTAFRSLIFTVCVRNFAASRFAVATASWIAKLIPTPPTGDIAWATYPIHSSPSRYHHRQWFHL